MHYPYVFFDLDGTLIQSEFGVGFSIRRALSAFGVAEPDDHELRRYIGPPLEHSFRHFAGLSAEQTREAIGIYRSYYNTEGYKQAPVYPGIPEAMQRLRDAGATLAVVTSKPEVIARKVLEYCQLMPCLDAMFGPDESEEDAPKSALIRRALSHYGLEEHKELAVMVGDRKYDAAGAREAGIDCIGVLYGYGDADELTQAGAGVLVETADRIPEVIL